MPNEAWYLLIACGALILALAIWKGRGITVSKDTIKVDAPEAPGGSGVNVANGVRVKGRVGNITGVSISGSDGTIQGPQPVNVLHDATVSEDGSVGDVVGVELKRGVTKS